jgi:hypothetical protein
MGPPTDWLIGVFGRHWTATRRFTAGPPRRHGSLEIMPHEFEAAEELWAEKYSPAGAKRELRKRFARFRNDLPGGEE